MMTEEEVDLLIERFKNELEEELSKPITVCPHCKQILSKAAAEYLQKSQQHRLNRIINAGATEELTK